MAQDEVQTTVIDKDPLRLRQCPNCGYSLEGLPASGACPECGSKYSEDEIVLYGWMPHWGEVHTMRGVTNYAVIGGVMMIAGVVLSLATSNDVFMWITMLGLGFAIQAPIQWDILKRYKDDNTGPRRLQLSPHGYGSRIGKGKIDLRSWERGIYVFADGRTPRSFMLHINKPRGKIQFKMFDRPFVPIKFIVNGDLALAERILTKMGKWWKIRPTSEVEPPFYRRTLKLGPLGKEIETRAGGENQISNNEDNRDHSRD